MRFVGQPMDELLRTYHKGQLSTNCQQVFQGIKDLLTHYEPKLQIIIVAKASMNYGIGAIIQHPLSGGTIRPVAHVPIRMPPAEKKNSQIDKEGVPIKVLQDNFYGRHFMFVTFVFYFDYSNFEACD